MEWTEITFHCADCNDDHDGVICPTKDCFSVEGPGLSGYTEVTS